MLIKEENTNLGPYIPDITLREKMQGAEALAKPLGLSHLTNAAKGGPSRKVSIKTWSEDGLFGIEQAI